MAKSLDLDSILGKPENKITKIGVELEGAWSPRPPGVRLEGDASVFKGVREAGYEYGEIPIGPMQPAALRGFLKKYYPHKVDETCGMHVHMSFESPLHYTILAAPEYQETVIEYLVRWGKEVGVPSNHCFWSRLAGKNEYCQKKYWPDEQIQTVQKDYDHHRPGHRYTMIHYCWRRGTIECRVLPMFDDYQVSIMAIRRLLLITNASLIMLAKKMPRRVKGKLELPTGEIYEEFIEEVL